MTIQTHKIIELFGYGLWQGANVSLAAALHFVPRLAITPDMEYAEWALRMFVTLLTGLSVVVAILVGINKLKKK